MSADKFISKVQVRLSLISDSLTNNQISSVLNSRYGGAATKTLPGSPLRSMIFKYGCVLRKLHPVVIGTRKHSEVGHRQRKAATTTKVQHSHRGPLCKRDLKSVKRGSLTSKSIVKRMVNLRAKCVVCGKFSLSDLEVFRRGNKRFLTRSTFSKRVTGRV